MADLLRSSRWRNDGAPGTSAPPFAMYLDERMVRSLLAGIGAFAAVEAGPPSEARFGADPVHEALNYLLRSAAGAGVLYEVSSEEDLKGVRPGELVAVSGMAHGNPLSPVLDFVATMMPLVFEPREPARGRAGPGQSGTRAVDREQEQAQRVLAGVVRSARDDLRAYPVVDVVMTTDGGLPVVMTLDREILGGAGEAFLRRRNVSVVGKVSAVLSPDSIINLFRHSAMATVGPQASREMLAELAEGGLELDLADPVIEGPGLEIIPLAVLI